MRNLGQYDITSHLYKEINELKYNAGRMDDFLEYLFDHGDMQHTTQKEEWAKFEKWEYEQELKEIKP